jgi:hypothetical protein
MLACLLGEQKGEWEMLGGRESPQTRRENWPKFPVDRSNDENAEPMGQNMHGAKSKRQEAKLHEKKEPSNVKLKRLRGFSRRSPRTQC